MRPIRAFLYKRGLRPKRDSIFYSPSLDLQYGYLDAVKKARHDYLKVMDSVHAAMPTVIYRPTGIVNQSDIRIVESPGMQDLRDNSIWNKDDK